MRSPIPLLLAIFATAPPCEAARLKDIARFTGTVDDHLVGTGIVVGLQGTGDAAEATRAVLRTLLSNGLGSFDASMLKSRNAALVAVTAELPSWAREGDRIDVTVSAIGDARSLAGGVLLASALYDAEGRAVWAVAQGPLLIGGYATASAGSAQAKNHATTARVPSGGKVERSSAASLAGRDTLALSLRQPDFHTAVSVGRAVNRSLSGDFAHARDAGTVDIAVPPAFLGRVPELIARLEMLDVLRDDKAKVVVNERTGTVVMGAHVRIREVALTHGDLSIRIDAENAISQPGAFSSGTTSAVTNARIDISEDDAPLHVVEGASIAEIVAALNALGVTPRDLVAILETLASAGALDAELEVL